MHDYINSTSPRIIILLSFSKRNDNNANLRRKMLNINVES